MQCCSDVRTTPWQLENDPRCAFSMAQCKQWTNCYIIFWISSLSGMLPEQLPPAKSPGLPSMADKHYFLKVSVSHKMSTSFETRGTWVSMGSEEEWRQLNSSKTFQNYSYYSSNNMLSLTRCESAVHNGCFDVFLKSVLLLNHYSQIIKPSAVHCNSWWLQCYRIPRIHRITGYVRSSLICRFVSSVQHWVACRWLSSNILVFFSETCYSLPGRWVSTHATWRWGGQNLSCNFTRQTNVANVTGKW